MIQTKHHSDFFTWKDKSFRFNIYPCREIPLDREFTQVYGLILNRSFDSILLVQSKNGLWLLPGGGVESGELLEDTLVREVLEETNRTLQLETIKPIYFQDVFLKSNAGTWEYETSQLRYSAVVESDNQFVSDPDEDILKVEWIEIDKIGDYLDWGDSVTFIQRELRDRVRRNPVNG